MIAKLIDGQLLSCPLTGIHNGIFHTNLVRFYERHPDIATANGYYPVRLTDKPEGNYMPSYETQEDANNNIEIVQIWTEFTPETDPIDPVEARLDFIEDCLLELSEAIYA